MPPTSSAEDNHHTSKRRPATTTITAATAKSAAAARAADPHDSLIKANVIAGISLSVAAVVILAAGLGWVLHRQSRRPRRTPTL